MLLVRRSIKLENLRSHHDVTDPLLAVLGTLFAILLGFMLANAMQRFENARVNIEQEAGAVGDIFRIADGLPEQIRTPIRKKCLDYLTLVVDEEFGLMQKGKFSQKAWNVYGDLWRDCVHYQPQTQGESNLHQELVGAMSHTGECRRIRYAQLRYCLPVSLWFILIFGGLCTVGFTYFFAIENIKLQILMTSVITSIVCLNIYMLAGFDAPFSGDIAITSTPFATMRETIEEVESKKLK
jgi:hypothetical protein